MSEAITLLKGISNPNFQTFSFEYQKKIMFLNKFSSRFQNSTTSKTEDICNHFSL